MRSTVSDGRHVILDRQRHLERAKPLSDLSADAMAIESNVVNREGCANVIGEEGYDAPCRLVDLRARQLLCFYLRANQRSCDHHLSAP